MSEVSDKREIAPLPGGELVEPLELSIVIPAFMEAGNLPMLLDEIREVLAPHGVVYEAIVVDDGSSDETWSTLCELCESDPMLRGIRLSRNFGHQYALLAGLTEARGSAVVTMDADLQHPPQLIPVLLDEWRQGSLVVQTKRKDSADVGWLKRLSSRLFYRVFSLLSGVNLTPGMADFRLLDRQVVSELVRFPEARLFMRGLVQWVGYRSAVVPFEARRRHSGSTSYTFRRMLTLAWAGVTSFSIIPLRIAIVVGLLTSLFAFFQLGSAVYQRIFNDATVPGWASVIGVTSLLFGVLFVLLGILGEYLARILEEVRRRPRFLVSEATGFDHDVVPRAER